MSSCGNTLSHIQQTGQHERTTKSQSKKHTRQARRTPTHTRGACVSPPAVRTLYQRQHQLQPVHRHAQCTQTQCVRQRRAVRSERQRHHRALHGATHCRQQLTTRHVRTVGVYERGGGGGRKMRIINNAVYAVIAGNNRGAVSARPALAPCTGVSTQRPHTVAVHAACGMRVTAECHIFSHSDQFRLRQWRLVEEKVATITW